MFTNRLIIGGPSVHLLSLVEYFHVKHEICLVFGCALDNEASMENEFAAFGIKMYKLNTLKRSLNPFPDIISMFEVSKIIKEFNPDIIHTHTFKPGIIGRISARRNKVPNIIHTYHGLIFDAYFSKFTSLVISKMDKKIADYTDTIIALSNIQKNQILKFIGEQQEVKIRVVPLSVSSDLYEFSESKEKKYRDEIGVSESKIILGMVGRLVEIKNVLQAIKVFSELKKDKSASNSILLIIGDGNQKQMLISKAKEYGLKVEMDKANDSTDVVFIAWQRDLIPVYSAMDLLVLSSKNEGTPFSIIEAQMMKTAVLTSSVGGVADIVDEGKTALLFSSEKEMKSKMKDFLLNPKKLSDFKNNAFNFAHNKFSMKNMLNIYEKLYN